MKITLEAPAKINLYLDVLSRLDNGFHSILSIMQTVSLSDSVTVTVNRSDNPSISVSCTDQAIPQDERNIAWKAAELYLRTFDIEGYSVEIHIEKRIPVCAGLAGGSTDAAAVLLALNSLFSEKATTADLLDCAAILGSDVPFCLLKGTKITRGRGEQMEDVSPLPSCDIIICSFGEGVSTAWAYGELDRIHGNFKCTGNCERTILSVTEGLNEADLRAVTENMYNIFEEAVLPLCPKAAKAKQLLLHNGADNAMMSGSGSAVFGVFTDRTKAEKAKEALEALGARVFLCAPQ